jgi:Protein of unknown function (DUF4232)
MPISGSTLLARASIALLAALALAACGGSGSTTGTGAAAPTTAATVTRTASQSASSTTTRASSASSSESSTASGPPPCRAAGLAPSFLGQQGATGHGELGFALRNTSTESCNTIGYPGVQFLARSGAPLPTSPTHTTNDFFGHSPLRNLIVGPGQTVSFRLGVTHGIGSSAGCTTAYGLQVIAPNDTVTRHVQIPGGATECGTATVSPVQAGTSAYP